PGALHARADRGGRDRVITSSERPRCGAGTGRSSVSRRVGRTWERLGRPASDRSQRTCDGTKRRLLVRVAASLAVAARGARLLLRLRQRGLVAAVSPGVFGTELPQTGLDRIRAGPAPLRRRCCGRNSNRATAGARPGLPPRARAPGAAGAMPRRSHRLLLAYSVAGCGPTGFVPVRPRPPAGAARQRPSR